MPDDLQPTDVDRLFLMRNAQRLGQEVDPTELAELSSFGESLGVMPEEPVSRDAGCSSAASGDAGRAATATGATTDINTRSDGAAASARDALSGRCRNDAEAQRYPGHRRSKQHAGEAQSRARSRSKARARPQAWDVTSAKSGASPSILRLAISAYSSLISMSTASRLRRSATRPTVPAAGETGRGRWPERCRRHVLAGQETSR